VPRQKRLEISKAERVTQSNDLARSAQDLDLNEKRLVLYTISRIKRGDRELLRHRFYLPELARVFGSNRNDLYRVVDQVTSNLLERVIYVETEKGWKKFQWTTLAEYVDGKRGGAAYVEIKLNEELEPYLIDLSERFNSVPLEELLRIPSFNSLRLFELCWHDSHGGKNTIVEYEIGDLKVRLGLKDVDGRWEKYQTYKDFRYVLDKAVEDIGKHTSLRLTYQPVRKGRSYSKLRFIIGRTSAPQLDTPLAGTGNVDPAELLRHRAAIQALEAAGFTQSPIETIKSYGIDVVERVLKKAKAAERRAAYTNRPIHNLGGLIAWMLKSGVGNEALPEDNDDEQPKELDREDLRKYADLLRDNYATARAGYLTNVWDGMTSDDHNEISDIMKAVLDRHTLTTLDKADWKGLIYEAARNRIMVSQGLVELPKHLRSIRGFVAEGIDLGLNKEAERKVVEEALRLEGE
jgi:hypothetical protein